MPCTIWPMVRAHWGGGTTYAVRPTAYDANNTGTAAPPLSVLVNDLPAVLTVAAVPAQAVGQPTPVSATFTDPGTSETHAGLIDWGDGTTSAATVTEADGSGTIAAAHAYARSGSYTAMLIVTDSGGAVATASAAVTVTDPAPTGPAGLTATVASPTEVDLAWTDHDPNGVADLVYASTDGGATFDPVGEVDAAAAAGAGVANAYQATGLTPGTAEQFYVVAEGADGTDSAPTATVTAALPFERPTLSAEGTATATEGGTYTLTLSADYPDGEAGAVDHWLVGGFAGGTGYVGSGGPLVVPAAADGGPTTVTGTVAGGPTVHLSAIAVDPANGSFAVDPTAHADDDGYGLTVAVTPATPDRVTAVANPLATDGTASVTLAWSTVSTFGTGTVVLMSTAGGPFFQQAAAPAGAATYTVGDLSPGTAYAFELATDSANGWSAVTAPVSTATPAATPPQLRVTIDPPAEDAPALTATAELSATYAPGLPDDQQVDHWLIDWGDPADPAGTTVTVAGAVATATHDYPAGTTSAQVSAWAVDGRGTATLAADRRPIAVTPAAATGLGAVLVTADPNAGGNPGVDLTWQGATSVPGVDYAVQRQDEPTGTWGTIGTVAADSADGAGHAYSFTDPSPLPVTAGGSSAGYRVTAAAGGSAAAAAATPAVLPALPGTNSDNQAGTGPAWPQGEFSYYGGHGVWAGSRDGTFATGVSVSGLPYNGYANDTGDNGDDDPNGDQTGPAPDPGPYSPGYAYDQPADVTIGGLPAHMWFGVTFYCYSSDATYPSGEGTPGDAVVLTGPDGQVNHGYGLGSEGYTFNMTVGDGGQDQSASFHLAPNLASSFDGTPVTWWVSSAIVTIGHATATVNDTVAMTKGGTYRVPIRCATNRDPVHDKPDVVHVSSLDPGVVAPVESTVTLGADDTGWVDVVATGGGANGSGVTGRLVVTDAIGDRHETAVSPALPTVSGGGTATVGGGATVPAGGPPVFTFGVVGVSETPISLSYALAGTTADPALYSGLGGTATVPAGADHVDVPVGLDYGYLKVSAQQRIVVTLPDAGGSDVAAGRGYPGQRATLFVNDQAKPIITIDGEQYGADVPIDRQGDDNDLIPVAMSEAHWGEVRAATLSWNPDLDLVWLQPHVGTPGLDDLANQPGVTRQNTPSGRLDTYTFPDAKLPSCVYFQALVGTRTDGMPADDSLTVAGRSDELGESYEELNTEVGDSTATPQGWDILLNSKTVLDDKAPLSASTIVGAMTSLFVGHTGGAAIPTDATYTWTLPGKTATSMIHVMNTKNGEPSSDGGVNDFTPGKTQEISDFYWYSGSFAGAVVQVQCTVQSASTGLDAVVKGELRVFRPNAKVLTSTDQLYAVNQSDGTGGLAYGNFEQKKYGITFKVAPTSTVPKGFGTGTYEFVQLMSRVDTFSPDSNGTKRRHSGEGLDGGYPYPTATGSDGIGTNDSPEIVRSLPYTTVSMAGTFHMYLMWNPTSTATPGSPSWVPLRRVDWLVSGSAKRDQAQKQWTIVSQFPDPNPDDQDQQSYPVWHELVLWGQFPGGDGDTWTPNKDV